MVGVKQRYSVKGRSVIHLQDNVEQKVQQPVLWSVSLLSYLLLVSIDTICCQRCVSLWSLTRFVELCFKSSLYIAGGIYCIKIVVVMSIGLGGFLIKIKWQSQVIIGTKKLTPSWFDSYQLADPTSKKKREIRWPVV